MKQYQAKADVLLGLQWGDEGKGKVVDVLTPRYDLVARFQGGPNAGHTLEFDGKKYVLRSIPSGIFQQNKTNVIGNGVVLDPVLFKAEAEELAASGTDIVDRLLLSSRANLILPTHRLLDAANEADKGADRIGTTGKGIGPAYTDKVSRVGLRIGQLLTDGFKARYEALRDAHLRQLGRMGFEIPADFVDIERQWLDSLEYLKRYRIIDTEHYVNRVLAEGRTVLCEGAQGTMLDIDFGSYPFVTSSNTVCAGACSGLGVAPRNIGEVYGIFKAYCTRVGAGPFPTELFDATGREMRDRGHEYGAVTGRERRCGWLDLVALKYAVTLNGVSKLIMMKSDVLDTFDTIKACVAYKISGEVTESFPFLTDGLEIEPVYKEFKGWKTPLDAITDAKDLPAAFVEYMTFVENYLDTTVTMISVGPDRKQTIHKRAFNNKS